LFFSGITISFLIQVLYDGFGPISDFPKFWGGLAIAVVLVSLLTAYVVLMKSSAKSRVS
jgi:ABC-type multidrug transport system permease subunit